MGGAWVKKTNVPLSYTPHGGGKESSSIEAVWTFFKSSKRETFLKGLGKKLGYRRKKKRRRVPVLGTKALGNGKRGTTRRTIRSRVRNSHLLE